MLLKEVKEDLEDFGAISCFGVGRFRIVKMLLLN